MPVVTARLRRDLIASRQEGEDGVMVVIKDPVTERFYRFREIEHFIAQQFDGATEPEQVCRRAEERFGVGLSPENVEHFLQRLRTLGLLTEQADGTVARMPGRSRMGGDLFYLRFRLFDPDRLFDWLLPRVRFLFTPAFLVVSGCLTVAAIRISVANWGEITQEFQSLFRFESLAVAWFVLLAVIAAHEFSHGLTCRHFGGRVREIGFLLIYFQPAFYCNVSDAWLFPEKSKRLWVTFAGAYFEVFLWSVATLVWRLTDPQSVLNHLALIVTVTSAFKAFFNLNPLIKLDGYYLLSDWLGIPNLRQRAFAHLRGQLRRWAGAAADATGVSPRERWLLPVYALLAGAYTWWLLGNIILWFGGFMTERYQAWGGIVFATTLGLLFRRPLGRLVTPAAPGAPPPPPPDGRRGLSSRARLGLAAAAALAILVFGRVELHVAGPFSVLPLHNADVRAAVEGTIEEIFVEEGDRIGAGAPVARLAGRDLTVELRMTRAEIEAQQAQLHLLQAGPRAEEVALARTELARAEEQLRYAGTLLDMERISYERQASSRKEFARAEAQAALDTQGVAAARNRLALLLAGSRPEEIEARQAEIRRLGARERHLQEQIAALDVASPVAGVVATPRLREKIGEKVGKGDLVAEVHELSSVIVEIAVPEDEIADVRVGQPVTLKARAHPHESFSGAVTAIAPVATRPPEEWRANRTVVVRTRLDNHAGLLRPEMTGHARIHCGDRSLLDLVSRRLVRFLRVEFWSWW